jgi:hypothetical protein
VPEPALLGVPEICQVALPPLLEDLVINIPGGMGVPETKLMFGLIRLLIVVQAVNWVTGELTLPFTVTEQLFPVMAMAELGRRNTRIEAHERQSFRNISNTYRSATKGFRTILRPQRDETFNWKPPYA